MKHKQYTISQECVAMLSQIRKDILGPREGSDHCPKINVRKSGWSCQTCYDIFTRVRTEHYGFTRGCPCTVYYNPKYLASVVGKIIAGKHPKINIKENTHYETRTTGRR